MPLIAPSANNKTASPELIKRQVDEDATVIGLAAVKHSFNTHDGIKIEYVDPTQMVYSPTEDPNFNDCYYFGEININYCVELINFAKYRLHRFVAKNELVVYLHA